MARNGRLQNVQLVDQDSDDESSSSGPPPLEDLDELNDHSSTSTIPTNAGTGTADPGLPVDSDEPPALESDGQESDSGAYQALILRATQTPGTLEAHTTSRCGCTAYVWPEWPLACN